VAIDPFLYVALALGVLAGRFLPHPGPWVPRATIATVAVLVALLGVILSGVEPYALVLAIPVALGFALLVLGLTAGIYLAIVRGRSGGTAPAAPSGSSSRIPWLSFGLLAALVVGYVLGRFITIPASAALPWALYVLLALVGFDLHLRWRALRGVWVPLAAAVTAAFGAAVVFWVVSGTALPVSLATTLAFGWYTLAGPLVVARAGAVLGLLAFLTNFFRENLTMVLSPVAGRRLRGAGLAALGGATAMDTTLYFVTHFGDEDAGSLALATGLVLTVTASLVLPAVLALPL
jgi:uncharacterized membrane protein YbjE (DUF340 family)